MAVGLRRLRRFPPPIRLNSAKMPPTWDGRSKYETPLIRGQSHTIGSSGNLEAPLRIAESSPRVRRGGFSPFTPISRGVPEVSKTFHT